MRERTISLECAPAVGADYHDAVLFILRSAHGKQTREGLERWGRGGGKEKKRAIRRKRKERKREKREKRGIAHLLRAPLPWEPTTTMLYSPFSAVPVMTSRGSPCISSVLYAN